MRAAPDRGAIERRVDVAVVGLGPTGAVLCGLLAQRGLSVAGFDQLSGLYPLPRAIGFDHEFMRVMQELRVADDVLPHTAPYRPSEYRNADGVLLRRLDTAPPPFRLGWEPNFVFDQPAVERAIRRRLGELDGVAMHTATTVVGLDDVPGGVRVRARSAEGALADVEATFVVACDGGASPIRKALGIGLEDLGFDEHWLVVDAIVEDDAVLARLPQNQVQYCEPERPSTFVVGPGRHRRWELMVLAGEHTTGTIADDDLWPLLARWIEPHEARIWRAAAYRFHGLVATRWRSGRVLLAGDSAHMTPPFLAQGMVQGTRDAQGLAWRLEEIVRHGGPDELLDSYEVERRPHVVATTSLSIELGRSICERDPRAAAERDTRVVEAHPDGVPTTIRQTLLPPVAPGPLVADAPGAGQPCPQPFVTVDAAHVRLDDITGARVRVLVCVPVEAEALAALEAAVRPARGRVVVLGDGPGALAEHGTVVAPWLRANGAIGAVVRPDHLVYATAPDLDGLVRLATRLVECITTAAAASAVGTVHHIGEAP